MSFYEARLIWLPGFETSPGCEILICSQWAGDRVNPHSLVTPPPGNSKPGGGRLGNCGQSAVRVGGDDSTGWPRRPPYAQGGGGGRSGTRDAEHGMEGGVGRDSAGPGGGVQIQMERTVATGRGCGNIPQGRGAGLFSGTWLLTRLPRLLGRGYVCIILYIAHIAYYICIVYVLYVYCAYCILYILYYTFLFKGVP